MIIHQINFCPVNKYNGNQFNTDLMSGFEQLESAWYRKVSGPSAIGNFRTKYEGEPGPNPRYKYHTIAYHTIPYRSIPYRTVPYPPPNNQAKPVIRRPVSANPGLNYNPNFIFFYSKASFSFREKEFH